MPEVRAGLRQSQSIARLRPVHETEKTKRLSGFTQAASDDQAMYPLTFLESEIF